MEIQIFGIRKSSDTRKALMFFAERRIQTHFVDLQERAASPGELRRFAQKFGIQALVDRESRRFADLGLGAARLSDDRWLDKLAEEPLQGGDRVLFYTDGIADSRAADGEPFGTERLADYLVRAILDRVPAAETVRRLSANVLSFVGARLRDDATMFLVEYRVDRPLDTDDPDL